MRRNCKYKVIANVSPRPNSVELSAARLAADFLHADVIFLTASQMHSADVNIAGQNWEIKSPQGARPETVLHQFQRATKQAQNLIFDARRIKMSSDRCLRRVKYCFRMSRRIKRVLFIDRNNSICEIFK